jgi:hypothetical protein
VNCVQWAFFKSATGIARKIATPKGEGNREHNRERHLPIPSPSSPHHAAHGAIRDQSRSRVCKSIMAILTPAMIPSAACLTALVILTGASTSSAFVSPLHHHHHHHHREHATLSQRSLLPSLVQADAATAAIALTEGSDALFAAGAVGVVILSMGLTSTLITNQLESILSTQVDDYLEIVKRQDVDKYDELVSATKNGESLLDRPDLISDVFSVGMQGDEKEKKELLFILSKAAGNPKLVEELRPQLEARLGSSLEDYVMDVGRYGFAEVVSDLDKELADILKAALVD